MHALNDELGLLPREQHQAFYQVGGTLDWDAPSYLVRNADQALFEGLRRGELCYVLDTRQVGKSSLLVRTAVRLLDQGIDIVQIDISKQGRNVTPESWYLGLLYQFTDQLSLWDTAEAFWESHASFSPVQRWFETIRQVVLIGRERPLVAFLDEIDAVRGLPFSADEFFASIRAVTQDQRSNSPSEPNAWRQLTFCFAGAATPAQLTCDVRATPFNIGTRIELTDFTEQDALPLAQGFAPADSAQCGALIAQVVYWTGGHPYLTQRLCSEVARAEATTPQQVDQLCRETFLDRKARETDPNLHFVHERILQDPENDRGALLRLYSTIRKGASVRYDPTSNLANTLRLAGLVTVSEGELRVRNRIYAEQFNPAWVQDSLRT
ncbi:AAA-like domain-containing protein, partial [Armatimonas sp.]|uniref:AAA-like domain-containing protein n=1 Tax=Armatimonas sp. TaxID=1872638 RepID=UPI0037516B9C